MRVECFIDTNVLVYAVSSSPAEATKKARAVDLIESTDFGLSAQVLQELYVTLTRKIARPLAPDAAVALLEELRKFPLAPTDYPLVVAGIETSLRFGVTYWDGAILAAAERLGAPILYTEDLNHGQQYGPVRVVNPFRLADGDGVHEPAAAPYTEPDGVRQSRAAEARRTTKGSRP
jgi:predicted nucleic acid-binding protein